MNYLIKICGVTDANIAEQAVCLGASMIGIVFHPQSPRYVTLQNAIKIAKAVKCSGAIPVAVFVNQPYTEMLSICEATGIQTVQLHGSLSRAEHCLLPSYYQRIFVLNLSAEYELMVEKGFYELNPLRDFILIDHIQPGKGQSIPHRHFRYNYPFPWLLAGGLSPENVNSAIAFFKPNGVDVSSGVEHIRGRKDIALIQAFISSTRGSYHVT